MTRWALRAPQSSLATLADLRGIPGIEAGETRDCYWLSGSKLSEALELQFRRVPGAELFTVNGDNELVPAGALVPSGYVPACDWTPIKDFFQVQLPAANEPALVDLKAVPLRLVPSTAERASTHLLVHVDAWSQWVESAALARLQCLKFAASADGQILVAGDPLPSVLGIHLWEEAGVIAPAGWEWVPRISAATVRRAVRATDDQIVLWLPRGNYELIRAGDFVVARRAAVRATAEALHERT